MKKILLVFFSIALGIPIGLGYAYSLFFFISYHQKRYFPAKKQIVSYFLAQKNTPIYSDPLGLSECFAGYIDYFGSKYRTSKLPQEGDSTLTPYDVYPVLLHAKKNEVFGVYEKCCGKSACAYRVDINGKQGFFGANTPGETDWKEVVQHSGGSWVFYRPLRLP